MRKSLPLLAFAAALVIAWFCYSASYGSDFQLDDQANIGGVVNVTDVETAIDFILGGMSGPTGRPLALLSFVMQADQWQQGPDAFLTVNIAIHLINALLLFLAVRQLLLLRGERARHALLIGSLASSVWVLLPLIATATLLVVQRMTTLSALFLLLGLVAYLGSRALLERAPRKALALMAVSLVGGSVLAALTKESGALLPLYVLVIESTLLRRPAATSRRVWRTWSAVFLWLPALAVAGYLISRWSYPDYLVLQRGFDAGERMLTQAELLWVYLSKALIGLPGRLGIFQGDFEVARTLWSPLTFLAVVAWLAALGAAIFWRRRFPLFAFGVLWYCTGHLVESTTIPLELYFEHRNYLPIIGPVVAIVALALLHSDRSRVIAVRVVPLVVLANAWFLYSFASLQGDPHVAARFWAIKYPDSVRAVGNLASYQMSDESVETSINTVTDFVSRNPQHGYLRIQELTMSCMIAPQQITPGRVDEIAGRLPSVNLSFIASDMLLRLFETVSAAECREVDTETVVRLANALLANPRYAEHPRYNQVHHMLLASIRRDLGDTVASLEHIDRALEYGPNVDVILMKTITLAENGELGRARAFLDQIAGSVPLNPLRAIRWRRIIGGLYDYVGAFEQQQLEQQ